MRRALALALVLIVCPLAARASDESDVLRARAALLAQQGKCAEAVPLLERAIAADPGEAKAGVLLARCQILGKDYAAAETTLDEALRRNPSEADAQLELAIARYHQENFAGARSALDAARPSLSGDARFQLYDGLVLLREGRRDEGIAALRRAREIDPKMVEPTASYVEGLALENEGELDEARRSMDRVITANPTGPWGTAARSRLDQWMFARGRPYWAAVTGGYESDSNVVLRGQGVDLPQDISDEADWRWIWNANAGYQFLSTPDWGAGAAVSYTGTEQHKLHDFDYDYVVGTMWLDRHLFENVSAHLQGDQGYGWTGSKSWVSEFAATPALDFSWGPNLYTRVFGRFSWSNYFFAPEGSTAFAIPAGSLVTDGDVVDYRNRDGRSEQAGVEQGIPVYALNTRLTAVAAYQRYHSEGAEYSYRGVGGWLSSETLLPLQFTLRTLAGFAYRGYLSNTSFEDVPPNGAPPNSEKRRDKISNFEVSIEHPLYYDWIIGSARWNYTDADSTVDVFDYDRIIYGLYVTVELP
jgi:tetratricopeptide (TPR) repeat protein